ncbi:MAG: LON peptidase substrate-binding domain-containing protein [Planctomycetes bacterium]|nr:LON peptidase substrate-binding domain-containing protein [Planctomycetota bacterium]
MRFRFVIDVGISWCMSKAVHVNFSQPMPVFPLPDEVLLPHALLPIHVFESHFYQLIEDSLQSTRQIAMASYINQRNQTSSFDSSSLRPAVCVGHIVQHAYLPSDQHDVLVQGICRAKIAELIDPDEDCSYLRAQITPLESLDDPLPLLPQVRDELIGLLGSRYLKRMRCVKTVMNWFEKDDVPTHALLELISFAMLGDGEIRYQLLAEADATRRADMILKQLTNLHQLVGQAEQQSFKAWPKGISWN